MCWWPCCNKKKNIVLVVAHDRATTSEGTGNVSRLNVNDGSTIWTHDLGYWNNQSQLKIPGRVRIDSEGNVYVAWFVNRPNGIEAACGGVTKLSKNGDVILNVAFPAGTIVPAAVQQYAPAVAIDPTDETNVYVGSLATSPLQAARMYRINGETGAIEDQYAPTILGSPVFYQSIGDVEVDKFGNIYANLGSAVASGGFLLTKFKRDGSKLYDFNNFISGTVGQMFFGLGTMATAVDPELGILAWARHGIETAVSPAASIPRFFRFNAAAPSGSLPYSWRKSLTDIAPPEAGMAGFFLDGPVGAAKFYDCTYASESVVFGSAAILFDELYVDELVDEDLILHRNRHYNLFSLNSALGTRLWITKIPEAESASHPVMGVAFERVNGILMAVVQNSETPVVRLNSFDGSQVWAVNPSLSGSSSYRGCDIRRI